MRPGANLNAGRTYYDGRAYSDLMRQCGGLGGNRNGTKPMPPMRPDGYPEWCDKTTGQPGGVLAQAAKLPAGQYRVRGRGRGLVELQFAETAKDPWQKIRLDGSGGDQAIELRELGADRLATCVVRESDQADPVRDLQIIIPGCDGIWRPEYLDDLRGFAVHRHLDTRMVNADPAIDWPGQPPSGLNSLWRGVPFEDLCDLANECGADPWFCIPYHASDDYVERMARVIDEHLDPGRTVFVEYSNELWNWGFRQAQQVEEWRKANEPNTSRQVVIGRRAAAAMNRFRSSLSSDRRCVRVVSGQAAWVADSERAVRTAMDLGGCDAIACAPYFGEVIPAGTSDLDGLFAAIEPSLQTSFDRAGSWATLADKLGVPLHLYECGQHLPGGDDPARVALIAAANRDPRMGSLYMRYLDGLAALGVDVACLFQAHGSYGKHGCWGLREDVGQPLEAAPKAAAVRAWMDAHKPAPVPEPVDPEPTPEPEPEPEPVDPTPEPAPRWPVVLSTEVSIEEDGRVTFRLNPAQLDALTRRED